MRPIVLILLPALWFGFGCQRRIDPAIATRNSAESPSPDGASNSSRSRGSEYQPTYALPPNWPYSHPEVVRGRRGMVVSDHAAATEVGRSILAEGGNAADAAVATAFALAVVYPTAGNLGGGGFAVTLVNGKAQALDFRETAPAKASRDMYKGRDGQAGEDASVGIRSVGVPGTVAGLWQLHQVLGSKQKNWAQLVAPAMRLAEEGFVVDDEFRNGLMRVVERIKKSPASVALFMPNGEIPPAGTRFRNPELAGVLRRIAAEGPNGFYRGRTAEAIVQQMKQDRGLLSEVDLEGYQAKWRNPLKFTYRGKTLISMPPPSSGGLTLAMICHILEGFEREGPEFNAEEWLHLKFEAMRRAFAARNANLGDPDFVKVPSEELLSAGWASEQRSTIKLDHATASSEIGTKGAASGNGPHTTHFGVVDALGNAVALTTTLNFSYGSGVTVRGTGMVLNNEMDDFAAVPGVPNGFGLVQSDANAIAPGKRMLSSMSPTIVTEPDGRVLLVAGAAGGPTIITAVFQEISNRLDLGLEFGLVVAAPRFHMQHLPDVVAMEKGGLALEARQRLEAMGHVFSERDHIADAPLIGRVGDEWLGIAEPRRPGALAAAP